MSLARVARAHLHSLTQKGCNNFLELDELPSCTIHDSTDDETRPFSAAESRIPQP